MSHIHPRSLSGAGFSGSERRMNDSISSSDGPDGGPADGSEPAVSQPLADAPIAEAPDLTEQLATGDTSPDPDAPSATPTTTTREAPESTGQREPRRLARAERERVERTRQRFAACGRCGYLIADLQLLLGAEKLQEVSLDARDGWLRLESDTQLRVLLSNAFGVRLDLDYEAMDGACPECRRRFIFTTMDGGRTQLKLHV